MNVVKPTLFVFGFFPVKPTLLGHSGLESFEEPICSNSNRNESQSDVPSHQLRSLYKVIDGLPAEFVLGKDIKPPRRDLIEVMPYIQWLLGNGMAVGYHAKAAPPTVTMPRLKAMVSGEIGGFLDVVLNFNTQAMVDDNLLGQFFKIGWKMVMFGDETWLKLFPELSVEICGRATRSPYNAASATASGSRSILSDSHFASTIERWLQRLKLVYISLKFVSKEINDL